MRWSDNESSGVSLLRNGSRKPSIWRPLSPCPLAGALDRPSCWDISPWSRDASETADPSGCDCRSTCTDTRVRQTHNALQYRWAVEASVLVQSQTKHHWISEDLYIERMSHVLWCFHGELELITVCFHDKQRLKRFIQVWNNMRKNTLMLMMKTVRL